MTVIRLLETGVINADADTVWTVLRDFTSAPKWTTEIVSSEMEDGASSSQVGGIRRMAFDFGAVARERLAALSDRERFFEYELLPPEELPVTEYLGKMQVIPIASSGQSLVMWRSSFGVADGDPEGAGLMLSQAYRSGIDGLGDYLANG